MAVKMVRGSNGQFRIVSAAAVEQEKKVSAVAKAMAAEPPKAAKPLKKVAKAPVPPSRPRSASVSSRTSSVAHPAIKSGAAKPAKKKVVKAAPASRPSTASGVRKKTNAVAQPAIKRALSGSPKVPPKPVRAQSVFVRKSVHGTPPPKPPVPKVHRAASFSRPEPPATERHNQFDEWREAQLAKGSQSAPVTKRAMLPPRRLEAADLETARAPDEAPPPPQIRGLDMIRHVDEADCHDMRGFALTGSIVYDKLQALIKKIPHAAVVSIYDSINLSNIADLRFLARVRTLYLGSLPRVTSRQIVDLFSTQGCFGSLDDVHLAGMPVSDEALQLLAQLPGLQKLNIASCNQVTRKGLTYLQKNCKTLTKLSVAGCSFIDAFSVEAFRRMRPEVRLTTSSVDPRIIERAVQEANHRMGDRKIEKQRIFFKEDKPHEALLFYGAMCELIGYQIQKKADPLYIEQVLQSYVALVQTAAAILKGGIKAGCFGERPPASVIDVLDWLGRPPTDRDLTELDLSFSGVAFVPRCVMERKWPRLQTISIEGTHLKKVPPGLMRGE